MDTYPAIKLKVLISYDVLSLSKRETDIAIRVTNQPPEYLVGRKVSCSGFATYAAKSYFDTHDFSKDRHDAHWIGWNYPKPCAEWIAESEFPYLPVRGYFNNTITQLAAVKAGLGIARLPCFMGDPDSTLQRVSPNVQESVQDIWMLTHKDLLSTVRIQTFMDFMAEAFREKRGLLEGKR